MFDISLLNLDLESFLFHFHFSISISSHFYFTFATVCADVKVKDCVIVQRIQNEYVFFLQEESVSVLNLRGEDDVSCSPTTQVCGEVLSSEMQWGNSRQVSNHKAFF